MLIQDLLKSCIEKRASDLHILPFMPPLLRIDGELVPYNDQPLNPEETEKLIYSMMTPLQIEAFNAQLVIDLAVYYPELGNFRASVLHQMRGIAAVLRIVPTKVPLFEELGFPTVFKRLLQLSQGLVLVTGSTGSGKSTSLAAMLDFINRNRSCHIITIEDPIEYIHESKKSAINQLQVGRDTPTFATALRAALRQDPDVIFVGELRDLETINLALIAAETGHLVLGTLHANSAPIAINRIVDAFPPVEKNRIRNLLSETIQGVICQTLVKKPSGGRVAAFEIMLGTPAIRHLIHQDMTGQMESTIQTSGDVGMCTMEQFLQDLANKQIISSATAKTVASNRKL